MGIVPVRGYDRYKHIPDVPITPPDDHSSSLTVPIGMWMAAMHCVEAPEMASSDPSAPVPKFYGETVELAEAAKAAAIKIYETTSVKVKLTDAQKRLSMANPAS